MAAKKKLQKYRQRFGSPSWFMSRLNEPLAKTSNAEDYVELVEWAGKSIVHPNKAKCLLILILCYSS
jgi:hypothetical protein